MTHRRYQGRLHYDGSSTDYIDVQSFIVRERDIGYSLDSVSQAYGRWAAESGKPAVLREDQTFVAEGVWASQLGVRSGCPWKITFTIEDEVAGETIELSGSIEEAGEVGSFYGELSACR